MKKIIFILIKILIFINYFYPDQQSDKSVDYYYNLIINTGSLSDKKETAKKIGKLKTINVKNALLKLMGNSSYWEREAACSGLAEFNDNDVYEILLDKYFNDFMITGEIESNFKSKINKYFIFLTGKYYTFSEDKKRYKLIDLLSSTGYQETEKFLKDIILDKNSKDRNYAFMNLTKYFKKNNYEFSKGFIEDNEVKEYAFYCILSEGSKEDLPLFLNLSKTQDTKYIVISCEAINKWGSDDLKKENYLKYLQSFDENLVQAVLFIFGNIQSEEIKSEIIKKIKLIKTQDTRLLLYENLIKYNKKEIVPFIIPVFKERFIQEKSNAAIDFFSAMFTLGFSTLLSNMSKKQNEKDFNKRLENINLNLRKITGVDNGVDYTKWFYWAIYNGYTVEGSNIIQFLYSSYPEERSKAIEQSVKLLGYKSYYDFINKNNISGDGGDKEILLKLTGQLIEKGILGDKL